MSEDCPLKITENHPFWWVTPSRMVADSPLKCFLWCKRYFFFKTELLHLHSVSLWKRREAENMNTWASWHVTAWGMNGQKLHDFAIVNRNIMTNQTFSISSFMRKICIYHFQVLQNLSITINGGDFLPLYTRSATVSIKVLNKDRTITMTLLTTCDIYSCYTFYLGTSHSPGNKSS